MRIEQLQTAIREEIPFEIATASGDKFRVTDRNKVIIAEGRGAMVLVTDDDLVDVIPFLTMTNLTYLKADGSRS
jgi:hypothetical protein